MHMIPVMFCDINSELMILVMFDDYDISFSMLNFSKLIIQLNNSPTRNNKRGDLINQQLHDKFIEQS
ncbi:hypothetical protein T11_7061 [Trichinella zimbabwensis]|uniref:Uncharacterized protein n=1 Tax=Trichinella zimbabwensis TaxID=268475 RepID=A0A0V1HKI6_9BILA|nr:hypothetical protein T11_7061 [Trichinella zimbabwensis]